MLFRRCKSLKYIPDISKWNTENVLDIGGLFYECSSLKEIPDISKWNVENVYIVNSIFYECSSLKQIPDISKWNLKNVFMKALMFFGCCKLEYLPDISKLKILNPDINFITLPLFFIKFRSYLTDIHEFLFVLKTFGKNYKEEDKIFIPNLEIKIPNSIDNIQHIIDYIIQEHIYSLYGFFAGCSSLKEIPDISKWDIRKINNLSCLFYGCSSLQKLPNISE